jgi:hypothetical protein
VQESMDRSSDRRAIKPLLLYLCHITAVPRHRVMGKTGDEGAAGFGFGTAP